ncbi:MAG: aspartate/glutamate racemase family protein [Candidatus Sumerlaeia bacterium]|nr:aspartate/glutamate racemase family protein [Candidatus Sumerlaeia bacterium]
MKMANKENPVNSDIHLFSQYMKVTGVPTLEALPSEDPLLRGKKLGAVNGSSWISLWVTFFGRRILPGVKIINVGNEAVQMNFMAAHRRGEPCPPQINIELFARYAEDLVRLVGVDAILITCSTMNRAFRTVREAMSQYGVPVVQIDEAMMERAVSADGRILVVATHGPTVKSTQDLLRETAARLGRQVQFAGVTVEEAFDRLGEGDIEGHNEVIAQAIRAKCAQEKMAVVVLAQLSMTVFKLSYPDCEREFGVPVLTSGETGFERVREILRARPAVHNVHPVHSVHAVRPDTMPLQETTR